MRKALGEGRAAWIRPWLLHRSCRPAYWTDDLAWPPFGLDVPGAENNRIPAQVRYESLVAGQ